ncbi:NB-ARC domain-containing protein [Spirulina sp. 06S082]|uniref:NB-ARC domain-containing protein n=1 Tax=Spirulina sp. 06S082 TaxID=3110248 RepID=UPI002B2089BA|nr:NB-ARC domain-containing protein [Spirulina sp. 06S082]MEA5470557.1 NB-ARC domain-containing protein [Spirulina sp. 06S082]
MDQPTYQRYQLSKLSTVNYQLSKLSTVNYQLQLILHDGSKYAMATLKSSKLGLSRIQQARKEKGWSWNAEDDTCFLEASQILEPTGTWHTGGPYAYGVSLGTWKRFLAGKYPISAKTFKVYCQILGLPWEEIVDRRDTHSSASKQDWDEEIDVSCFYGREEELGQLEQWILGDRCRLIILSGMGGIGKTSLSVKLGENLQEQFQYVLRRSLRHEPPIGDLLTEIHTFLCTKTEPQIPPAIEEQIAQIVEFLRDRRCLLLLDDFEAILSRGKLAGQYQKNHQNYSELIRRIGQERHQSCLLIVTREKPREITALASDSSPIRALKLRGLSLEKARKILTDRGFSASQNGTNQLIQLYRGHPLALKLISSTIQDIFGGEIFEFLKQSTLVLGDIMPTIFYQQFDRLSTLEREIVYWLTIEGDPVSLSQIKNDLRFSGTSSSEIVAALESLKRRSLLEISKSIDGFAEFTLGTVFMKYITKQLLDEFLREIETILEGRSLQNIKIMKTHCLVSPRGERNDKRDLILRKLQEKLELTLSFADGLEEVMEILKDRAMKDIGYAKINLSAVLSTNK